MQALATAFLLAIAAGLGFGIGLYGAFQVVDTFDSFLVHRKATKLRKAAPQLLSLPVIDPSALPQNTTKSREMAPKSGFFELEPYLESFSPEVYTTHATSDRDVARRLLVEGDPMEECPDEIRHLVKAVVERLIAEVPLGQWTDRLEAAADDLFAIPAPQGV